MLELAGGRGGDMWKHCQYGAREILLVDIDDKALVVCMRLARIESPLRYDETLEAFHLPTDPSVSVYPAFLTLRTF